MRAAVDWEKIYLDEIKAEGKVADRPLSAAEKFNYVLEWEQRFLPRIQQIQNATSQAIKEGGPDLYRNLSQVAYEVLCRVPDEPTEVYASQIKTWDFAILLRPNPLHIPPLEKTFPVSHVYDQQGNWAADVRIVHPILLGALANLLTTRAGTIKAIRPLAENRDPIIYVDHTIH